MCKPNNENKIVRNLKGQALKNYKSKLSLNKTQKEVIIGTLLGDASISLNSGKPIYSIKFEQSIKHKGYVEDLYKLFEPYVGTSPTERFSDTVNTKLAIWFRTYNHDHFKFYYDLFYDIKIDINGNNKGIKKVPKNIQHYLTDRAVAYWFMDDGSYNDNDGERDFLFHTQGFEKSDVEILIAALKNKFNIIASTRKDGKYIVLAIKRSSTPTLLNLIKPYIHPDFFYKFSDIQKKSLGM